MTNGKIIIGIIILIAGISLLIASFFFFPLIIYAVIIIGVGIAIIVMHDSDQKIEQRKDLNKSNSKK